MKPCVSTKTHPANYIVAGVVNGTLRPWRTDLNGIQWYEPVPVIHGGPPADLAVADHDEGNTGLHYELCDEEGADDEYID